MANIQIKQLTETTTANSSDYIAIDNGSQTRKITVNNFNATGAGSAQRSAAAAAASATAAANSKTGAEQARDQTQALINSAQTLVSNAQTYANTAQLSAAEANTSAARATAQAATAQQAANTASTYAQYVTDSAMEARSYAVGGTGTRIGEDTDNSRYYCDTAHDSEVNASNSAAQSNANAVLAESWAIGDTNTRTGENANNSRYYSRNSEAWAIGERGGEPVTSGDITYQNNSKYYSGVAQSTYELCSDVLTEVRAYYVLIRVLLGIIYLCTEDGFNLLTENGDNIILDV